VVGVVPPDTFQVWFAPLLHVQICSRVPFAELPPLASRHLPDPVLTSAPLETVHFWAPVALQS